MSLPYARIVIAGIAGTIAMTVVGLYVAPMILVMPMMGMPLFSGSVMIALASMLGHVIYGIVVAMIMATATATRTVNSSRVVA